MVEAEEIRFEEDTENNECIFSRFRIRNETFSELNASILDYKCNGKTKMFKNPKRGMLRLNVESFKNGTQMHKGDIVAWWIGPCKHEVIWKDLCTMCSMDMNKTGFVEARQRGDAQYVSTVHNVTSLYVQLDTAKKLHNDQQQRLLERQKLILLIDLDQTLIHTTNKPPKSNETQDIHTFKLFNVFYRTKIRNHTFKLLDKMSKLFELHVVTYGQRAYAEQIVRLIDPEKTYFSSRILTRNELISSNSKSLNLQAIFPSGSQLILMIDDRPDVWENSDALVWIKPYRYFTEVGDINDLYSRRSDSLLDKEIAKESSEEANNGKVVEEIENESNGDQEPSTSIISKIDTDDILENVERILTDIHQAFFEHYKHDKQVKPVREFAAEIRKHVLEGEFIVFSGVVRQGTDMTTHPLYQCCVRFGAVVQEELTDQSTILIAVKAQTEKYHAAKRRGIPIVTPKWIEECMAYWKKPDKSKFALQITTEYEYAMNTGLSHMDRLSKDALMEMQDEVDRELAELSENSSEEDDIGPSPNKKKHLDE